MALLMHFEFNQVSMAILSLASFPSDWALDQSLSWIQGTAIGVRPIVISIHWTQAEEDVLSIGYQTGSAMGQSSKEPHYSIS